MISLIWINHLNSFYFPHSLSSSFLQYVSNKPLNTFFYKKNTLFFNVIEAWSMIMLRNWDVYFCNKYHSCLLEITKKLSKIIIHPRSVYQGFMSFKRRRRKDFDRKENIGENWELFQIFWMSIFLKSDKLMLMINIFLTLKILNNIY